MNKPLALAVFSAILLSLSFLNLNLEFLAWFGIVPLLFALEGKNKPQARLPGGQAFLISYVCGFLFFVASMYWLIHVTAIGWIGLSLYQALYFGFFGLVFYFIRTRNYLVISSAWVFLEYIRSNLFGGIGWNLLGYSQYKNLPIIQIADFTGVYGISFLIMLMNIAIYGTIKMAVKCYNLDSAFKIKGKSFKEDIKTNPVVLTLAVLVLFISVLVYGHKSLSGNNAQYSIPNTQYKSLAKVSIIQGNIPQKLKWDEKYTRYIMDTYEKLTIQAAKDKPLLIIWPETSVPGFLNYERELLRWLKRLITKTGANVLVGAPMVREENLDEDYNSAVLFSKRAGFLGQYDKLHLVLLGEFIPFEKYLPFLRKISPLSGNFVPGKEYTVFNLPSADFSVLICFEDIFPGLVRQFVKKGAQFMVNMTNDAWFGNSCAAYQHAANSVFRAVENRRSFVRSANTGLSCFIDKQGRIYEKISADSRDLFIEGVKSAWVSVESGKILTFYTKYGDVFVLCCIIILSISAVRKISLTIR